MAAPAIRPSGLAVGWPSWRSLKGRKPSTSPTAKQRSRPMSSSLAVAMHASAKRSWPMKTFDSESLTM